MNQMGWQPAVGARAPVAVCLKNCESSVIRRVGKEGFEVSESL